MSHFSTIKTQLKDTEPLIKALNNLGYMINQEEKFIKGYRGKFTAVDISINLPGETKVGFKWDNISNSYELVTDLDLWKFEIPVERLFLKLLKCMLTIQLFLKQKRMDTKLWNKKIKMMVLSSWF